MDAADLLNAVEQALQCGKPVPAEAARWLLQGFNSYRAGADLEEALLLRGETGQRSVRYRQAKATRDTHLRRACRLLNAPRPWNRTEELLSEIESYASAGWDIDYQRGAPRTDDPLRAELFAAFSAGIPLPRSAMGLHKIVSR